MPVLTVEEGSLATHMALSLAWALHSLDRSHCQALALLGRQHTPVQQLAHLVHMSHCTLLPWCEALPIPAPQKGGRKYGIIISDLISCNPILGIQKGHEKCISFVW